MALINIFFWAVLILAAISFGVIFHQYEKSKQLALDELEKLYQYEINGHRNVQHQYRNQYNKQYLNHGSANAKLPSQTESLTKLHIQKHKTVMQNRNVTHSFRKIHIVGSGAYAVELDHAI